MDCVYHVPGARLVLRTFCTPVCSPLVASILFIFIFWPGSSSFQFCMVPFVIGLMWQVVFYLLSLLLRLMVLHGWLSSVWSCWTLLWSLPWRTRSTKTWPPSSLSTLWPLLRLWMPSEMERYNFCQWLNDVLSWENFMACGRNLLNDVGGSHQDLSVSVSGACSSDNMG